MNDMIAMWPDGEWCYMDELEEWLQFKSDDYEIVEPIIENA